MQLAERRVTRQIHVGDVAVGGGAPVTVQSMTTTKTADVDGTLAQIYEVAGAGPTLNGRNGGGDRYFTDGEIVIGVLRPTVDAAAPPPRRLPSPAATALKGRVWAAILAAGRSLGLVPVPHTLQGGEQALSPCPPAAG